MLVGAILIILYFFFLKAEPDEEALAKMLEKMAFGTESGFGGDGASGDLGGLGGLGGLGDILPAMQGMLQSLLSKDLLYPSIKEIVNKVSAANYIEYNLFVLITRNH